MSIDILEQLFDLSYNHLVKHISMYRTASSFASSSGSGMPRFPDLKNTLAVASVNQPRYVFEVDAAVTPRAKGLVQELFPDIAHADNDSDTPLLEQPAYGGGGAFKSIHEASKKSPIKEDRNASSHVEGCNETDVFVLPEPLATMDDVDEMIRLKEDSIILHKQSTSELLSKSSLVSELQNSGINASAPSASSFGIAADKMLKSCSQRLSVSSVANTIMATSLEDSIPAERNILSNVGIDLASPAPAPRTARIAEAGVQNAEGSALASAIPTSPSSLTKTHLRGSPHTTKSVLLVGTEAPQNTEYRLIDKNATPQRNSPLTK